MEVIDKVNDNAPIPTYIDMYLHNYVDNDVRIELHITHTGMMVLSIS